MRSRVYASICPIIRTPLLWYAAVHLVDRRYRVIAARPVLSSSSTAAWRKANASNVTLTAHVEDEHRPFQSVVM